MTYENNETETIKVIKTEMTMDFKFAPKKFGGRRTISFRQESSSDTKKGPCVQNH